MRQRWTREVCIRCTKNTTDKVCTPECSPDSLADRTAALRSPAAPPGRERCGKLVHSVLEDLVRAGGDAPVSGSPPAQEGRPAERGPAAPRPPKSGSHPSPGRRSAVRGLHLRPCTELDERRNAVRPLRKGRPEQDGVPPLDPALPLAAAAMGMDGMEEDRRHESQGGPAHPARNSSSLPWEGPQGEWKGFSPRWSWDLPAQMTTARPRDLVQSRKLGRDSADPIDAVHFPEVANFNFSPYHPWARFDQPGFCKLCSLVCRAVAASKRGWMSGRRGCIANGCMDTWEMDRYARRFSFGVVFLFRVPNPIRVDRSNAIPFLPQ